MELLGCLSSLLKVALTLCIHIHSELLLYYLSLFPNRIFILLGKISNITVIIFAISYFCHLYQYYLIVFFISIYLVYLYTFQLFFIKIFFYGIFNHIQNRI